MMQEIVIGENEKQNLVLVHNTSESAERVIRLAGQGAEVHIDEIFLDGTVTSNLVIVHDARRTISRVRTRGVVGKGQNILAHAKIIIACHAQLSDTFVSQKFMLLDKSARAE